MDGCTLCPRKCNVLRAEGKIGFCAQTFDIRLSRAALHFYEEPCISGKNGSGAVFFSGCTLRCIFCQNMPISRGSSGITVSVERLSDIFLELQDKGAENINLVTPTHYVVQIKQALDLAKKKGLSLPVVYNTSCYELPETIKLLEDYVDIFLPDIKYVSRDLAEKFSGAENYAEYAFKALDEMVRQVRDKGGACFDDRGLMKRGVIVRHLVLPGHVHETFAVLDRLYETYGNEICYSIMNQYTPPQMVPGYDKEFSLKYEELNRKLTKREYEKCIDHALELGITNAFIQEGMTASESFIPSFDGTGVRE